MNRKLVAHTALVLGVALSGAMLTHGVLAAPDEAYGAQWTAEGKLKLPGDFHTWVFLGAPLTPHALNGGAAGFPEYHNVYVHPAAYKIYRDTGRWPEGTVLLKELQLTRKATHEDGSSDEASGRGYFPAQLNGIDISVKDSQRFAATSGWGFFNFGHHAPPYAAVAEAAPKDACAGCHEANATEDMVFTKFYEPILKAR